MGVFLVQCKKEKGCSLQYSALADYSNKRISEFTGEKKWAYYTQLSRACPTNIRPQDMQHIGLTTRVQEWIDRKSLARSDARIIKIQKKLLRQHKRISMIGTVEENRLIDGTFIDSENYTVEEEKKTKKERISYAAICFLESVLRCSCEYMCAGREERQEYLDHLSEETEYTGIKFVFQISEAGYYTIAKEILQSS